MCFSVVTSGRPGEALSQRGVPAVKWHRVTVPGFAVASAPQRFSGFLAWLLCGPSPERGNQPVIIKERRVLQKTEAAPPVQGVRAGVSSGWARRLAPQAAHAVSLTEEEHWPAGLRLRE